MRIRGGIFIRIVMMTAACHGGAPHPAAPQLDTPVVPAPAVPVASAHDACGALLGALQHYRDCPHLDEDGRATMQAWADYATTYFTAADPERLELSDESQRTIARGCEAATRSVSRADERCRAGEPRWIEKPAPNP